MNPQEHGSESTERRIRSTKMQFSFKNLNLPLTGFYVILTTIQYIFCCSAIEPLIGNLWAHLSFLILFTPLTVYFLWENQIGSRLEYVASNIEGFVKNHSELWFAARIVVEITAIIFFLYFIGSTSTFAVAIDWSWLKQILLWIFLTDALVTFLSIYGNKQTRQSIGESVNAAFQQVNELVRKDAIKEIFYLSSVVSVTLKMILTTLIIVGHFGAIGIAGGILIVILPYFLLSVLYTALFITGSFGATARYWQWLLTEPPKIVVRFIFKIRRDKIRCRHCSRVINLVGTYECPKCHFKYKGFYFGWCPSCYSRYTFIDCECGLSRKRPFLH